MDYVKRFMVEPGEKVKLSQRDPGAAPGRDGKKEALKALAANVDRIREQQYLLYAENKRSLLIVLQAMDAGGKDGTIRRVLGPLNPQGVRVTSFKTPTEEELAHDFLWRIHRAVPRRGMIGVFNRSHYEDVLIARVRKLVPKGVWTKRYEQINDFEKMLSLNGVQVLKFYLHISKDEQLDRLKKRLEDPRKQWKANPADFDDRQRWDDYTRAYEDVLTECGTPHAPWFIIPANRKWFRNVAVSEIIARAMEGLGMKYPKPAFDLSKIVAR